MNRLKEIFKEEIAPALKEELSIDNVMEVPTVQKIVVNVGVGDSLVYPMSLDEVVRYLTVITGQRPVVTKAKHSIASSK